MKIITQLFFVAVAFFAAWFLTNTLIQASHNKAEKVQLLYDGSQELLVGMEINTVHEILGEPTNTEIKLYNNSVTYKEFYVKEHSGKRPISIGIAVEYEGYGTKEVKVKTYAIDLTREGSRITILRDKPLTVSNI